jgi:hypothetical protein
VVLNIETVCRFESLQPHTRLFGFISNKPADSVALVRDRTFPIERSPIVGEVRANFEGSGVPHSQSGGSLLP